MVSSARAQVEVSASAPSPSSAALPARPSATVYAFFATWCVPCRVEIPHLERLHRSYREQGVRVVLVSEDAPSTAQSVPAFLARFDVSAEWQLDSESELLAKYNPSGGVPFTVLLGPQDELVYAHAGYEPGDEVELEAQIQKLVQRPESAATSAARATWSLSSQSLGIWRESQFRVGDERQRALAQRLEVAAQTKTISASARVDGELVDDNRFGQDAFAKDARVERALLSYGTDALDLHLGDRYAQFGHGVSLSLRKIDSLGLDTTLRGSRIDAKFKGVHATVLGGVTNRQNLDPIDLQVVEDEGDILAGSELKFALGEKSNLAPYVLLARADGAASDGSDVRWRIGGVSTQVALRDFTIAAEAAGGTRGGLTATGDDEKIWAGYASAQWRLGDLTLLVDGKYYKDWAIGRTRSERTIFYHEAPTLERDDQEVPANDNAIGTRGRLEWRLPDTESTLFANMLGYQFSQDGTSAMDGGIALHGYLGGESRFSNGASLGVQAGFRDENRADGDDKLSLWHVDLDYASPITKRLSATFKWNHREEKKIVFNELAFRRGLVVGGLAWSGVVTASVLYGYSTEQATTPTHYPAGELLVHLSRGGQLRLFGGRLTGGRVCVSGSCRDVPPFEGARLDLILRM